MSARQVSAPTVGRFLPGYTGTPACNWTVNQAGETICTVRRDLHQAVLLATRLRGGAKRTAAVWAAMEAHAAHHCTPEPRVAVEEGREVSERPEASAPRKGALPSAVTLFAIEAAHHDVVSKAKAMVAERAYPETDVYASAITAYVDAEMAFGRLLHEYRPALRRQPISAYLNEEPAV